MNFKAKFFLKIVIPTTFFYCLTVFILRVLGYSTFDIIKDNSFFNKGIFEGLISNIGISIWLAAGLLIFFCILKNKDTILLNCVGGITSFYLFFLDLYDFHNDRLYLYKFSITGSIFYLPIIISTLFIWFELIKKKISEEYSFYLWFSYMFLLGSIFIDFNQSNELFLNLGMEFSQLLEEACKFIGIIVWFFFWFKIQKAPKT